MISPVPRELVVVFGNIEHVNLQGAQWMPRDRVLGARAARSVGTPRAQKCGLANAPNVAAAAAAAVPIGDRCSLFLADFCGGTWRSNPATRHLPRLECRYPGEDHAATSGWFLAQSAGSAAGACPNPAALLWPPSKVTYPRCSASIARLGRQRGVALDAHFSEPPRQPDSLAVLQAAAHLDDAEVCPPPELFRWSPDGILWPDCERFIRAKCAPGEPCNVGGAMAWGSEAVQRSFAHAQDWAAGRGQCPSSLESRWRPGELFYPRCSGAIANWCFARAVAEECSAAQPDARGRFWRVEAQRWVHATSRSCPDPDREFLWPWTADSIPPVSTSAINRGLVKGANGGEGSTFQEVKVATKPPAR